MSEVPQKSRRPYTAPAPELGPGQSSYTSITEAIGNIVLTRRTPLTWMVTVAIGMSLMGILNIAIAWLLYEGVGVWGLNIPIGWGFAIINFVWWIGIGHAGTLISAVLLLFRQKWRTSINRSAEAHDDFRRHVRRHFSGHPHRPALAGDLLALPRIPTPWISGPSSDRR